MRRVTRSLCGRRRLAAMTIFGRFLPSPARRYDPGAHGPLVLPRRGAVPRRVPGLAERQRPPAAAHLEWERKLFDARYAVVSWPRAYGGREASLWEWLIFEEEYYAAGAPQRVTQNGIFLLAPTIFEFGTQEQKDYVLPRMAAGEQTWAQGWSEPNAGSDLAGISSKAMRDDSRGGWRLTGQKTWTTRGAFCTH